MYLVDDSCEVGPGEVRHGEMRGYLLVEPLLVEGRHFSFSEVVDEPLPECLRLAKVVLHFLVRKREVRTEVFPEYRFVGVLRQIVFDPVPFEDLQCERVLGKSALEIFRGLRERSFRFIELASSIAVHDDDCLSAPVEPSSGLLLAEEVRPSADEVDGF